MSAQALKEEDARMQRIYDQERMGMRLKGGSYHFNYDMDSPDKDVYLCNNLQSDVFEGCTQERLLVFQVKRLWDYDCAVSLVFAFVWRKPGSEIPLLKVELRDQTSKIPMQGDFNATFVKSLTFSNDAQRQELIDSYFKGKNVKDEVLDDHNVVPIMMSAARMVNSLPVDIVQASHMNFMDEYNYFINPPYCESELSSVPTIPMRTQAMNGGNFGMPQDPYSMHVLPNQGMPMMMQPQSPMAHCTPEQMMSSPEGMMTMLQAMMQMINNPTPESAVQQPHQPHPMYQAQNQMMQAIKSMQTAAQNYTPMGNMTMPPQRMNMPGMNYPYFMPPTATKTTPEYSYVDAPCAALPYRYYSKIFRHIAHSYIDRLVYQKDYHNEKYLWVATEKVKGFSMSLITDGIHVSVGTRSEILTTKEHYDKFPQWHDVFEPYFGKLLQTFKYCKENHFPQLRSLQVFVELFGGDYPHPNVQNIPYNKPIVREDPVFYAPDYHLYAFDIYINGDFIPFNQTLDILEACNWLHAKILAAGTFEEIMEFDVHNLKSFIPEHLNLPAIEGNIAEGIVLRMLHHTRRFKKKRDIHGLTSPEPRKLEYFTPEQERLLDIGRGFFTVERLFENLRNQSPEHVELWAKTYPSRLVGRLLADGCKRFRSEHASAIQNAWIKKKVPFGRYFKPHVQKVVEEYIKTFQDGSDSSSFESSNDSQEEQEE